MKVICNHTEDIPRCKDCYHSVPHEPDAMPCTEPAYCDVDDDINMGQKVACVEVGGD